MLSCLRNTIIRLPVGRRKRQWRLLESAGRSRPSSLSSLSSSTPSRPPDGPSLYEPPRKTTCGSRRRGRRSRSLCSPTSTSARTRGPSGARSKTWIPWRSCPLYSIMKTQVWYYHLTIGFDLRSVVRKNCSTVWIDDFVVGFKLIHCNWSFLTREILW